MSVSWLEIIGRRKIFPSCRLPQKPRPMKNLSFVRPRCFPLPPSRSNLMIGAGLKPEILRSPAVSGSIWQDIVVSGFDSLRAAPSE